MVPVPVRPQAPVPPRVLSPVSVTKRKALFCAVALLLMRAPSPPTPVPTMETGSAPRLKPFTSKVAPL